MRRMVWVRRFAPQLQVAEHADQSPNPDTAQSTGQHCVLQANTPTRFGHTKPPWAGDSTTVR
jgi:hypothetical protein